ncbi:MAG: SDR family NAD(P)-dependent oxidoreductase [Pseudomonadota bacterium]
MALSAANPELAKALGDALRARGIDAEVTGDPGKARAGLIVLTEGVQPGNAATDRHWNVLNQCKNLRDCGVPIILLGWHEHARAAELSGLHGLARTLRQEWPDARISALDVSTECSPQDMARAMLAGVPDGRLAQGKLSVEQISERALALPAAAPASKGGNWLITGGARGVTAACTIELARHFRSGTIFLAGRSEIVDWPADLPVCDDLKTLRSALVARARQRAERPRPAEIDQEARALLAGQDVRRTLASLSDAGVCAHYIQLDISKRKKVAAQVKRLVDTHGAITGLVHGAGVLADRLAAQKTKTDVTRVFAPKVDGLLNLLSGLDLTSLQYCGLFCSAAAVFGNPGQSDYAMANAWLNAAARDLHAKHDHLTVKSFCWGPWAGGMVDETLAAQFEDRGIPLIGLQDGAEIFARHLLYAGRGSVNLLIGERWPS